MNWLFWSFYSSAACIEALRYAFYMCQWKIFCFEWHRRRNKNVVNGFKCKIEVRACWVSLERLKPYPKMYPQMMCTVEHTKRLPSNEMSQRNDLYLFSICNDVRISNRTNKNLMIFSRDLLTVIIVVYHLNNSALTIAYTLTQ